MNWIDEGALYSQLGAFLREDLGRGDVTTQSIIARNTRAKARFVANESIVVAGLEAAEEIFLTLDSQQQLEAFASDGENVEAGKVIARMVGFADVLITAERVALNLLQRMSGVATLTSQFVKAVEGTSARIVDTRAATPGLRLLDRYAVELGGGINGRFSLDDGVLISSNHLAIVGGAGAAVRHAKESLGHLHRVAVECQTANEIKEAVEAGAGSIVLDAASDVQELVNVAKGISSQVMVEVGGVVTLDNVKELAATGVDLVRVDALTNSAPAASISFQVQPF